MRKVSNTMLAVVAAIQSGAHTRRKPKYIREQALVSNLYPFQVSDPTGVSAYFGDSSNSTHDQVNNIYATFSGVLRSSLVDLVSKENDDIYDTKTNFNIDINYQSTSYKELVVDNEIYHSITSFNLTVSKYSINFVDIQPAAPDLYESVTGFNLAILRS